MCGIAGLIDFGRDISCEKNNLSAMSKTLINRGPDSSGEWLGTHAMFAHRRLSVIDPENGIQPMYREIDGFNYVITYNGELYNAWELKKQLESLGWSFYTNCDTEVLLVSYIQWDVECLQKINGIYAFGIWDAKRERLFLARDRFGVKPLFYAVVDSTLIFGSELKAILAHPLIKPELTFDGICDIFVLGPSRTPGNGIYKNVYELKPSEFLLMDKAHIITKKYWSLESKPHEDNINDTIESLYYLIRDSIERQLVSDVPVCTFLSGGLDSSVITAFAAKWLNIKKGINLNTFSIDYKDNSKYFNPSLFQPDSDSPWIEKMSEDFKTRHHAVLLNTNQLINSLEMAAEARDLPGMADIDSSLWLFCREVKQHAKVALSGECADEILGGYPWFYNKEFLCKNTFPWAVNIKDKYAIFTDEFINLIKPEEYMTRRYLETLSEVPYLPGESDEEKKRRELFYLNIVWFMSTLLERKDRMSMAHGLEVRVPYCDHRLVQYAWNIPWELKYFKSREKGLFREAVSKILPFEIAWRKKSPYPKTHNPLYESEVQKIAIEIANDCSSPLCRIIDKNKLNNLMREQKGISKPWFGQLMAVPQLYAYIIQLYFWMKKYNICV